MAWHGEEGGRVEGKEEGGSFLGWGEGEKRRKKKR
jgi:hypothetical protein